MGCLWAQLVHLLCKMFWVGLKIRLQSCTNGNIKKYITEIILTYSQGQVFFVISGEKWREHESGVSYIVHDGALCVGGGLHVPLKPEHSTKAIHRS